MATQKQISESIRQQLRILDPSISAEDGTPERKIIDTVAQAIADAQVDLNVLNGAFDVEAKYSSDLDNMLAILGFGRQQGSKATGFVTFSRADVATAPVVINANTTIFTPSGGSNNTSVVFRTTTTVTLPIGSKSVTAPIEAIQAGTIGNVAAGTITETVGNPIYGITSVNNDYPTTGGQDAESDVELKARFMTNGAFRNVAGTRDQYTALALSTVSKKANVVGPISTYQEYIQVPDNSDVSGGTEYTTALSNNTNSKHIYDNAPYFVMNDSGVSPVYYNADMDFVLNVLPTKKAKGDALRNVASVDPTSTTAPTIYQPNVTFTNVYTDLMTNKPEDAIAPGDTLFFQHSYMSTASRNDYDRNILNCVDVYVNGEDAQNASSMISRPGVEVPTHLFTDDVYSAFYVNNYRRVDEPGHRPVKGNVYTPLYKQPIINLPNQISLSTGTFQKGIHYWLVEETTNLYGTIRARNGIEWSSTIKAKTSNDPDIGPYTGPYIADTSISSTTLSVDLPSSSSISTTTAAQTYTVTNKQLTSNVAKLTIGTHTLNVNDVVAVTGVDSTFNQTSAKITAIDSTSISYQLTASNVASTSSSGTVTLSTIYSGNKTPIKLTSTDFLPASGYILIGSEIVQFSAKTGSTGSPANTLTITGRGQFGTTAKDIPASATTVNVLFQVAQASGLPTNDTLLIGSEQISYNLPVGTSTSLVQPILRGINGSYVTSHSNGDTVSVLFTTVDKSISIENYQYDANIILLQSLLDNNKQVTTDVLAHKAKTRYFKPDITVMYSPSANKTNINESIRKSLANYFDTVYFGNEIQMSDILQTVHNVGGVDNVKWSRDTLDEQSKNYDSDGDARIRMVETNVYGDPVATPVLDLVRVGDGITPTEYRLYLPYLSKIDQSELSVPTNITTSTSTSTGTLGAGTYYYTVTAINVNGETTAGTATSGVAVTGSTNTVTINWNPVDKATGYKVYRTTLAGPDFSTGKLLVAQIDDQGTTSLDDDGSYTLTAGIPPTTNTAIIANIHTDVVSTFDIQYANNQPITIQYDDFILTTFDVNALYAKGDIVMYGGLYYQSQVDNNEGNEPTATSSSYWKQDTVNKIGFQAKINSLGNVVNVTSPNNFVSGPSFDNYITIKLINPASSDRLQITNSIINNGYGAYNDDFQIGDDELVALPNGTQDDVGNLIMSSVMTVRVKSQNTWSNRV
jgi:uncharacterized phage protein gp47/JayE